LLPFLVAQLHQEDSSQTQQALPLLLDLVLSPAVPAMLPQPLLQHLPTPPTNGKRTEQAQISLTSLNKFKNHHSTTWLPIQHSELVYTIRI
jgi:hypothetical protein